MALTDRIGLYGKLEALRNRPLIVYVTSCRRNVESQIPEDVISEVVAQLQTIPANAKELDLLLVSSGGDGTVARRIVSLIRK